MTKKNKRRGFTIVELVIVIAVIAILAAVLIPTYANLVKKANEAKAQAEAKNLVTEMLANILSGGDDAADLIIVTKKGNEAYVHGYDASAGQLVAYKNNPVTIPEGDNFYAQAQAICEAMATDKKLNTVAVTEGSWRDSEKLKANMASLGFKAEETAVFANYDIVSLTQNVTVVKTADDLKTAIEGGGYVVIDQDITLSQSLKISADKNVTVDLNGKKISNGGNKVFEVMGELEINGTGTIASPDMPIWINGGKCTLNGGDVIGSGGEYSCAVFMEENGSGAPTFIMNGGSLKGDTYSLTTNNVYSSPSVAVINNGVLEGAIYWPSSGSLTIGRVGGSNSDVKVTGGVALEACCGTITVNCGTLISNLKNDGRDETDFLKDFAFQHSGLISTGDAAIFFVRRGSGYNKYPLNLIINEGIFTSDGVECGLRIVDCNKGEQTVRNTITINGGTYTGGEGVKAVDYDSAEGFVTDNRINK